MSRTLHNLRNDLIWVFFVSELGRSCNFVSTEELWELAEMLDFQIRNDEGLTARQLMLDRSCHDFIMGSSVFTKPKGAQVAPFVREALNTLAMREESYQRRPEQLSRSVRAAGGGSDALTPAVPTQLRSVRIAGRSIPITTDTSASVGRTADWSAASGGGRSLAHLSWDDDVDFADKTERGKDGHARGARSESGKSDLDDIRCGARYFLCADGKKILTTDTDGIAKRIAEFQHILRMMPGKRRKELFGTGLRLNLEHVRSVFEERHVRFMMSGETDEWWRSVEFFNRVRDLPAVKDDKKFTLLLQGHWDWRMIRELSLLDFVVGSTSWRVWEKQSCTTIGLQYLIQATQNALLVMEVIFGVPCTRIGEDLLDVFRSDLRMIGTTDAFNFHQVNQVFASEFHDARLKVLEDDEWDDPQLRMDGPDACARRLQAGLSAIIPRIPTGIATTVVIDKFNKITYPRIVWHLKETKDDKQGRKRKNDELSGSETDDADEQAKKVKNRDKNNKKDKNGGKVTMIPKNPVKPANGGTGSNAGGDHDDGAPRTLCGFHLARLLKMNNKAGKLIECNRKDCPSHHLPSLAEHTRESVLALVPASWSHFGAETRQRYEQAISAMPDTAFKRA
jgi:hypothetical protein